LPWGRNLETIKTKNKKNYSQKKNKQKRIKEQTTTKEAPIGVL
jgi:hypothetical protein